MKAQLSTNLKQACDLLSEGRLVAIPTETVYGLAADISNEEAVKNIFKYKGRPDFNPLIVHIARQEQVLQIAREWPESAQLLSEKFWPGPLTIIVPKKPEISDIVSAGLNTVGLRVPNHELTLKLLEKYNKPLAAPSANLSTKTSPTCADHVLKEFPDRDLLVLDGGECSVGIESTVLEVRESENEVKIILYRLGMITREQISDALKGLSKKVKIHVKGGQASPGQMKDHYMPPVPLIIVPEAQGLSEIIVLKKIQPHLSLKTLREIVLDDDPIITARRLFALLREKTQQEVNGIFIQRKKNQTGSFWEAIWDRLSRAATLDLTQ